MYRSIAGIGSVPLGTFLALVHTRLVLSAPPTASNRISSDDHPVRFLFLICVLVDDAWYIMGWSRRATWLAGSICVRVQVLVLVSILASFPFRAR
jgi:hypothetical protein